jgi:antirestriction protein ArdC
MTVAFDKRAIMRNIHWLNVMKGDKKAIFTAACEASEAAAFLAAPVSCVKAKRAPLGAA